MLYSSLDGQDLGVVEMRMLPTLMMAMRLVVMIIILKMIVGRGQGHQQVSSFTRLSVGMMLRCIPHICHGRHGQRPCKFFFAGVNFYRFNAKIGIFDRFYAKKWRFLQI